MRRALALLLFAACGGSAPPPVAAPPSPPAPIVEAPPADPRVAADLASFDVVWGRVAESFYDPAYAGVDWKAVRAELRPKILATTTREQARAIMNQALDRLGKSHFGVTGPLDEVSEEVPEGDAEIGIDLRILSGKAIVVRVEPGSPAERAKIKLGDELVSVGQVQLADRIAAVSAKGGDSSLAPMLQTRAVAALLLGATGTQVTVGVAGRSPVSIERTHLGKLATFGNLGSHHVRYDARWLDDRTGYIRLSIFLDPPRVVPEFGKDLEKFAKATGVIIDLRGNPGGIGVMATGMAGHLVSEAQKKLGTMHTRDATLDFVINPQATRYTGKVAILIDELSASTSEIFAGGLQDLGRAKVFGRRSPGAALPSLFETLPNGDRFQYAIADYVSTSGKVLEGNGVAPDVPVALDLPVLRSGKDPDLVAATRWIKEKP